MQQRNILLVRHSFAESSFNKPDIERTLTLQGIEALNSLNNEISKIVKPDLAIVSCAARTRQTFEILNNTWNIGSNHIWISNSLYNGSVEDYKQAIEEVPSDIKTIALIGHNPTISYLANSLNSDFVQGFSPANLLLLSSKSNNWQLYKAQWQIEKYITKSSI